jgi:type VI protein secretion system component VasK
MASQIERTLVRILIGAALLVAIITAALAPTSALPAVALGQMWLYRLEVSLLAFYGCLLLVTPAFSGLIRGRLPVEISTRGARFAEETKRYAALDEVTIKELEETIGDLTQVIANAQIEIRHLNRTVSTDNTQREVDSTR